MKLCTGQRLRCRHLWRAMKQFLHPFSTVLIKTKGIAYCILPQMAERGDNVAHMSNWGASLDLELCQVAFAEIDFKTAFKTIKIPLPTVHTKLAFLTAEIFFAEDLLIDFNYILFTERVENINPFLCFFFMAVCLLSPEHCRIFEKLKIIVLMLIWMIWPVQLEIIQFWSFKAGFEL